MKQRINTTVWLATGAGILFFVLFLWDVDWQEMAQVFAETKLGWCGVTLCFTALMYIFRTFRWQLLLKPVVDVPWGRLLNYMCIGFGANVLLPGRAGEFIKPLLVSRRHEVKFSTVFATVVLERVADLIILLLFLAVTLSTIEPVTVENKATMAGLEQAGLAFIVATLGAIVFLLCLNRWTDQTRRLVMWLARPLPDWIASRVAALVDTFVMGLRGLKSGWTLVKVLFWSLALWMSCVGAFWSVGKALDLGIGYIEAVVPFVATAFAVALPQAPGYIGAYQWACYLAMQLCGVAKSPAEAYALLTWALATLPVAVLSLGLLWLEGMSLTRLREEGSKVRLESEEEP